MTIYDVFDRDEWAIRAMLDALSASHLREERPGLLACVDETLLHHGRAASRLYGAALAAGAPADPILAAIDAHVFTRTFVTGVASEPWPDARWEEFVGLLRLVLDSYFEEHHEVCADARDRLPLSQAARIAEWHEAKRAAERNATPVCA